MNTVTLPLWADIVIALLVLLGASLALLGSIGLLRLPTFFERVHAPSLIATSASWCLMHASVLYFSLSHQQLALYPLLIAVFLAITVPITTIFLMRAGLFRARQADLEVPANVSHVAQPDARDHRA
jgi:multicomponent K+:H+ antiporter subunit G